MDANILNNIKAYLLDGFEKDFFKETIKNLDIHSRLRKSNFSYAIRELIREVLARMSPDEKVLASRWFQPHDKDDSKKITRAQRMMYAIHGGINPIFVVEELHIDTREIIKYLNQKIQELSKYTHVTEKIFYECDNKDTEEIIAEELSLFSEFLITINDCKESVVEKLHDKLCEHVIDEFFSSSIDEVDELSTHHCVDEVLTECITVNNINERYIEIEVEGTISGEQSWGSSSDFRNDNGVVIHSDFPFVSSICIEAFQPDDFKVVEYNYHVNTSLGRNE